MPVNTMAMPASSAALITSSSRIEPPGWITAVAPASIATSKPSANGKNASEATTEPLVSGSASPLPCAASSALRAAMRAAVDAAHLAGADADGGAILGVDDGVRLHVLGDAEGETQIGKLGVGRRALRHDLQRHVVDHGVVARLHQHAAGDRLERHAAGARIGQAAGEQQAQVLLRRDDRDRFLAGVGRDDHLGENLGDGARGFGIERAVERDDAAERRDRSRRRAPCGRRRPAAGFGDAARIGVLDDDAGGGARGIELGRRTHTPRRCR